MIGLWSIRGAIGAVGCDKSIFTGCIRLEHADVSLYSTSTDIGSPSAGLAVHRDWNEMITAAEEDSDRAIGMRGRKHIGSIATCGLRTTYRDTGHNTCPGGCSPVDRIHLQVRAS